MIYKLRGALRDSGTTLETPSKVSGLDLDTWKIIRKVKLVKDDKASPNQWLPPQDTLR